MMEYKIIINACSPSFMSRVEEAASFIKAHRSVLNNKPGTDEAIIFYNDDTVKELVASGLPFQVISLVKVKHYQPELILKILKELEGNRPAEAYLFPGDFAGNELAVRFARRLNGSSMVTVEKIVVKTGRLFGLKKVYSGNLRGSFLLRKKPYCLSLARGMKKVEFAKSEGPQKTVMHDYSSLPDDLHLAEYLETPVPEINEKSFEKADFIIAVGRGAGSGKEISRLTNIARELGAELGVSRPVVMNAWAPLDRLIGASGAVVSPNICLALAVSGSPPFYYGIEGSKKIIAVNHDEHAPVTKAADLVIIEDYKKVIEALVKLIRRENDV